MRTCDQCDAKYSGGYEVRIPRPSDPRDMCCIMWLCETCGSDSETCKTPREWDRWIENEGAEKGFLWLS